MCPSFTLHVLENAHEFECSCQDPSLFQNPKSSVPDDDKSTAQEDKVSTEESPVNQDTRDGGHWGNEITRPSTTPLMIPENSMASNITMDKP